jgi:hypothetical protein
MGLLELGCVVGGVALIAAIKAQHEGEEDREEIRAGFMRERVAELTSSGMTPDAAITIATAEADAEGL